MDNCRLSPFILYYLCTFLPQSLVLYQQRDSVSTRAYLLFGIKGSEYQFVMELSVNYLKEHEKTY